MAHYALLDENNIVTNVFPGVDETELIEGLDPETFYGRLHNCVCKRTSYNTKVNVHLLNGQPFRGNYAGIGFYYDENKDVFIEPKPFPSWILRESDLRWIPPVPYPVDGRWLKGQLGNLNPPTHITDEPNVTTNPDGPLYCWNEETLSFVQATNQ